MPRYILDDDDTLPLRDAFSRRLDEIDFDPFGDEEDGSARRRDPLRKPIGVRLQEENGD
jgi:hypothetical protein